MKYVLSLPLRPVTVFTDLMAKGKVFQSFGAAYVKKRSLSVKLDSSALDNYRGGNSFPVYIHVEQDMLLN